MKPQTLKPHEQYLRNAQGEIEFVILPVRIYHQVIEALQDADQTLSDEQPRHFTLDDALRLTSEKQNG